MVSDVVIAGYLKEKKSRDKFRYIETYSKRGFGEEVIPFLIPLLYWTRDVRRGEGRLIQIHSHGIT